MSELMEIWSEKHRQVIEERKAEALDNISKCIGSITASVEEIQLLTGINQGERSEAK